MATKKTTAGAPRSNSPAVAGRKAVVKRTPARRKTPVRPGETGEVLKELKSLAKELSKAAKGLEGRRGKKGEPKEISTVLGNVERMTAEAATKSLNEAEAAKAQVQSVLDSLGRDWSRKGIEAALKTVSGHLTAIIVAQEKEIATIEKWLKAKGK